MSGEALFLMKATAFAAAKHSTQRRMNAPYIEHPIRVAEFTATALPSGGSCGTASRQDVIAAALLHGTLEETDTSAEELLTQFGSTVLQLVVECNNDKSLPMAERMRRQRNHVRDVSPGAKLIIMADALDNMRDLVGDKCPESWSEEHVQGYLISKESVMQACYGVSKGADIVLKSFFQKHITVPTAERADALERYYKSMEEVDD